TGPESKRYRVGRVRTGRSPNPGLSCAHSAAAAAKLAGSAFLRMADRNVRPTEAGRPVPSDALAVTSLGFDVDALHSQVIELLVGHSFFIQSLLQQAGGLIIAEHLGVGPYGAVAGDFIVLDLLRRPDEAGIHDFGLGVFFHQLLAFFNQPFHGLALLALGALIQFLENLFEALNVAFGFLKMRLKSLLEGSIAGGVG